MNDQVMIGQHPIAQLLNSSYIQQDAENKVAGYRYTSANAISQKMAKALSDAGLYVASVEMGFVGHEGQVYREIISRSDDKLLLVTVKCRIMLSDGENTYGPYEGLGSGADTGDKAVMKAETAAFKYAISRVACMSWGDDPEADTTTDLLTGPRKEAKKPVDSKAAFSASLTKKALEDAAKGGTKAFRARWKDAPREDLDVINQEFPNWTSEMKGLCKDVDKLNQTENPADVPVA